MKYNTGFSFIEVIITMAIIAILATVAWPSYQQQIEKGNLSECIAFSFQLASELEKYYSINLNYPQSLANAPGIPSNSETNKCSASIQAQCTDGRCIGYNLTVRRNGIGSSRLRQQCQGLSLSHLGVKGAFDENGNSVAADICWH